MEFFCFGLVGILAIMLMVWLYNLLFKHDTPGKVKDISTNRPRITTSDAYNVYSGVVELGGQGHDTPTWQDREAARAQEIRQDALKGNQEVAERLYHNQKGTEILSGHVPEEMLD